jgi:hypothetical protein
LGVFGDDLNGIPSLTFGLPAAGIANVGQPREMQFQARIAF